MTTKQSLKRAFIDSGDLYEDFVRKKFKSFEQYLEWADTNNEVMQTWLVEREFRILEGCKSGLYDQALRGNSAAVSNLRALLGLTNSPGRPRGSKQDLDAEYQAALAKRTSDDYAEDAARLLK